MNRGQEGKGGRQRIDLCGTWRFQPDPHGDGEEIGFNRSNVAASDWGEVAVPSVFEATLPSLDRYRGIMWYRRVLDIPADWRGKRVSLHFEAVNYRARVWFNGQLVGENRDAFLPFDCQIAQAMRLGEKNVLVVSVDSHPYDGDVPGADVQWRGFGGIIREVWAEASDLLHIERLEIEAAPSDGGGRLAARVFVRNERATAVRAEARIAVADSAGKTVLELLAGGDCAPGTSTVLTAQGTVVGAAAWSPDSPNLYMANVRLHDARGEVDALETRFGFRRIEADATGLRLNGKPIYLTGFNRHEDSPHTFGAIDRQTMREDLLRMKDCGANVIRLCHYPHHPAELDFCDEIGLLVLVEIPLNLRIDAPRLESAARQVRCMIQRDRNHPSIIFWSVGNETNDEDAFAAQANRDLIALARQLDGSRLCVHVSHRWQNAPNFEADDVICVNYYPNIEGWLGRRGRNPQGDIERSADKWRSSLAKLHEQYPNKPILVTEFGYASIAGTYGHGLGEDLHERVIRTEFPILMEQPFLCGVCLWCWADHLWPPNGTFDNLSVSPFGVNTRLRTPKKPFAVIRALYRARQGLDRQ